MCELGIELGFKVAQLGDGELCEVDCVDALAMRLDLLNGEHTPALLLLGRFGGHCVACWSSCDV